MNNIVEVLKNEIVNINMEIAQADEAVNQALANKKELLNKIKQVEKALKVFEINISHT